MEKTYIVEVAPKGQTGYTQSKKITEKVFNLFTDDQESLEAFLIKNFHFKKVTDPEDLQPQTIKDTRIGSVKLIREQYGKEALVRFVEYAMLQKEPRCAHHVHTTTRPSVFLRKFAIKVEVNMIADGWRNTEVYFPNHVVEFLISRKEVSKSHLEEMAQKVVKERFAKFSRNIVFGQDVKAIEVSLEATAEATPFVFVESLVELGGTNTVPLAVFTY